MPFIPHTPDEVKEMLNQIGVSSLEELFSEIPKSHRIKKKSNLPAALSESDVSNLLASLAHKNNPLTCFLGSGCYDHTIPAAVWQTASRGEFYSSYTPYQSEVSQGTLQTIYEYQSIMAELTGQEVSNASLYDGASALAEAMLMACRIKPHCKTILLASALLPNCLAAAQTITRSQNCIIDQIPLTKKTLVDIQSLKKNLESRKEEVSAVMISFPNYFGAFDAVEEITDITHFYGALVISYVNPIALATLIPPGEWGEKGADITCGDGQTLGIPMNSGGPSYGFMTTKKKYLRQLPGRIAGKTTTADGKPGYTLTLQAREQHIRRSKATSNICTNQGLAVTASTIYLSIMGSAGLDAAFCASSHNTRFLISQLARLKGVQPIIKKNYGYENTILLPVSTKKFITRMQNYGIAAGSHIDLRMYPLLKDHYNLSEIKRMLILSVTEKRNKKEIEEYIKYAKIAIRKS